MRARAASFVVSGAFHAALGLSFVILASPGTRDAPPETPLVTLRLQRPAPERPAAASVGSTVEKARGESAATAANPGLQEPAPALPASAPTRADAPAAGSRPPISSLTAYASVSAAGSPPLPSATERLASSATPRRGGQVAAAAMAPTAAATLREAPRRDAPPATTAAVAAPAVRPAPAELLRDMQAAEAPPQASPDQAAPAGLTGTVQQEVGGGGRTLSRQPGLPYPSGLLAEGREADVSIRIRIRPDGTVVPAGILQTSGDAGVDAAVERVVREYLFNALDGATIVEGTVTFHFRLTRGF